MKKRLASTLLALALCLSLLPTAALAEGGVIKLTQENYTEYLEKTYDNAYYYLKDGMYILEGDITLNDTLRIGYGKGYNSDQVSNVNLDLNGYVLKLNRNDQPVIEVYCGSVLTIQDSRPDVTHRFHADEIGRWKLDEKNGEHEVCGGTIVQEGSGTALRLQSNDWSSQPHSTCTMNGGNVIGGTYSSYGGGVYVGTHAEFTMNGGSIRGCTVTDPTHGDGGGVYVLGTFTMTGGTISDCTAAHEGGGVYIDEYMTCIGAMYANGGQVAGTVTNTGTITSNDATSTTFTGSVTNNGTISGGTFNGELENKGTGTIAGYTVTYMNGETAYTKQVVPSGGKLIQPADPTRSGYRFNGWYRDGIAWDFTKTIAENIGETITDPLTLTAQWSRKSSGGSPSYGITAAETNHGTVALSAQSAKRGSTVTITVKPDSGYVLETLAVVDGSGNEQKLTDQGEGQYTFTMPSGKVEVKATFQEDNSVLNVFYDVPNDAYYYEAVKWAVGKGITNGVSENLFGPDRDCTRAQIVTFLWRAAGSPVVNDAMDLTDVPADAYYAEAVRWALSEGITTGTGAGTFSPDAACTRAQAVTFLARALDGKTEGAANFQDVPAGSYYAEAVAWALETGVTNGISETLFGPDQTCTRGQIVTFLFRAYAGK